MLIGINATNIESIVSHLRNAAVILTHSTSVRVDHVQEVCPARPSPPRTAQIILNREFLSLSFDLL